MNTLNQKLNIIKLYFQADKKRIFAAVLVFTLAAGCAWATLAPKTLADEYGYTYGVGGYDYGSDWGSYSPSYGGYDYSTPYYDSGYSDYYSAPYYDYGSGYDYSPSYSDYSPYSYDYYSTPSYDYSSGYGYDPYGSYGYDPYGYGSYGYDSSGYDPYGYGSSGYDPYGYDSSGYGSSYDPYYSSYSPFSFDFGFGYDSGYGYYPYSDGSYFSDINENYTSITNENININENINENTIRINDQVVYPYDYNNYYNDYYDGYDSDYYNSYYDDYYNGYGYDYNDYGNDYGQGGYGGGYDYYGANPQFNIFTPYSHTQEFNRDYFLFDIKNDTKGTDYNDPVNADPGDILTFSIYYHNAIDQTVAQNTKVRVSIPSSSGTNIVSTAYLSADNASQISETGTVYLSSAQSLEFISGSARWFPDGKNPDIDSSVPFPFSQSGNEIVGSGVNIGDIKGCWEWAGFVSLKVKVKEVLPPPTQPNLNLRKSVQNLTNPNGTDVDNTASPGDILKYTLTYQNTGNSNLHNVVIIDSLPQFTTLHSVGENGSFDSSANKITWNIGTLGIGQTGSVSYQVKVVSGTGSYIPRNYTIYMKNAAFDPNNATVRKGDKVIFVNNDSVAHTVTHSAFGGQHVVQPGQSYTLDTAGLNTIQYDYQCDFHSNMKGTLIVMDQPASQTPTTCFVIQNTAKAKSDQTGEVTSNEVRTRVCPPGITPPPSPPAPPVKAVTGAADILNTSATAATASGLAVMILYFVMRHFDLFTKLRLNWNTFGIRMKERMF